MQSEVRADANGDRQGLALALGALEREAQMPAEVELDGGAARAGQLQAMIGGIVGAAIGVAHDHDPGGDEAAGIRRGVMERGQHADQIDVAGVDVLLRRRLLHQHRRLRRAERPPDELADAVEVDAEGGLAIALAGQQVSDDRDIVAIDRGEQQRWSAVESLHDRRNLEARIDRRCIGIEPSERGHAPERRTESRIEDAGIGHWSRPPLRTRAL